MFWLANPNWRKVKKRNQNDRLRMRKVGLAPILIGVLFLSFATAEQEVTDHRVKVKMDKTFIIAPQGSGVSRGMMSMARHPDGTIFLNAQNLLVKSSDNGQSWTNVPGTVLLHSTHPSLRRLRHEPDRHTRPRREGYPRVK